MEESPQNQYAKNLRQPFGYPLRSPEPKPGLPSSYRDHGLHIGDVGYVNDRGMFEVQFNICFDLEHDLHQGKSLNGLVGLTSFAPNQVPVIPDEFSAGSAICYGIQGTQGVNLEHNTQGQPCEFKSSSTSGAILILPSGAVCQNLDENLEKEFRMLAKEHALQWSRFVDRKSLYLITGFYKTCSWCLASFQDVRPIGQVLLKRDDAGCYTYNTCCGFRQSRKDNFDLNQTVFISGFKIEVRGWDWYPRPVVEKLPLHPRNIWSELASWARYLFSMLVLLIALKSVHVNRVPALSQPFHPSDIINHYLLEKNPKAPVAITHDSQWLGMLQRDGLSQTDMVDERRFRTFLEENYTDDITCDNVVYLRRKIEDCNDLRNSRLSRGTFFIPTAASGNIRQCVITCIRAENIVTCLKRMPVGFYVAIQFNDMRKRTKCRPASLHDSIIEWDDEIMLPMDPTAKVRFSIHASSEFEPVLGNGDMLYTFKEMSVKTLVHPGSTCLLRGANNTSSCPSLLITCEERWIDPFADWNNGNEDPACEDCSYIQGAKETDKGHNAFLCYHQGQGTKNLEESVECFQLALVHFPSGHECHAAALFNHTTARFIKSQVHGTVSALDGIITSYHKVLRLRLGRHPDRPQTLLHLAQTLLYRQGKVQWEASVADEIEGLATEIKQISSESSYDHRAADLVMQTLRRYRVLTSGEFAELDELVSVLGQSVRMPPDWHFDRPYRLMNFGIVLRKRFEITDRLGDIEKSISMMEEALQLVSESHFDKPWMLASLGDARRVRFVQRGGVADLDRSISMIEDAMKLLPGDHPDKPMMLASLGDALRVRFVRGGDVADLHRSISMLEDAMELLDGHPDKPGMLISLGDALRANFLQCGDVTDLDRSISVIEKAMELTPDGHFDKPRMRASLDDSHRMYLVKSDVHDIPDNLTSLSPAATNQPVSMTERVRVLREMLSSERAYASDLALIRDIHIPLALGQPAPFNSNGTPNIPSFLPSSGSASLSRTVSIASDSSSVSAQPGPPMTRDDVRIIFGNISDLAMLSDHFVGRLEEALGGALDNGNDEDRVGTLFLEVIPALELPYKTYITRHTTALAHLNALPPSPALSAYLSHTRTLASPLTHAWDLPSLLIKPVQQLLKYSLLLGAIINATPDSHSDRPALVKARERMEEVARGISDNLRRWEVVREVLGGTLPSANETGKSKKGNGIVNVDVRAAASGYLSRIRNSLRGPRPKDVVGRVPDSAEAVEVARLEGELQRYAAFLDRLAKDVEDWRLSMRQALVALWQWGITFGAVLGLTPSPSVLDASRPIDKPDAEGRSEAYDAFMLLLASLPGLCVDLEQELQQSFIPLLSNLKAMMEPPTKLLNAMHSLEPLHVALLHTPFKSGRPTPSLLAASQSYLALRSALSSELPILLQGMNKATGLAVRIIADKQSLFYTAVRERWAELWDALRVDGERFGGSEETLRVWWERWGDVETQLSLMTATRKSWVVDRVKVAAPQVQRRLSDESLRSGKSAQPSRRSGKNSRAEGPPVPRLKPNFLEMSSHESQRRRTNPTVPPPQTTPSQSSQAFVDLENQHPPSPLALDVLDTREPDSEYGMRRTWQRSSSVKSLGAHSSLVPAYHSTDTPLQSSSSHQSQTHSSNGSVSLSSQRARPSPTLAATRALYTTRVIHLCLPPVGISYRGLPFFRLVCDDLFDVLREYGHPLTHVDLPLYVDDGEDCLLLVRARSKGDGHEVGDVGWTLASFLLPVD